MADIVRVRDWHDYGVIRIGPRLKAFAWGQSDAIASLLGLGEVEGPIAEAWFGAHESDPSTLADGGDLRSHIAADPAGLVGGDRLPYLLKVLAIESPLSLQVHPTMAQAIAGYDSEERQHIDIAAPDRTFRDPRHKPELIVALTEMRVLVGLRGARELAEDLRELEADDLLALVEGRESLLTYVMAVLGGECGEEALARLAELPDGDTSMGLAARAARAFPGDPGALVALAMNAVVLQPGEGCYVAPRIIHSYQSGIGVEIMANSDNVVRGGLTPKAVDVARLESILDAAPAGAERPVVTRTGGVTEYSVGVPDFALLRVEAGEATLPAAPRIVLALDETTVTTAGDTLTLAPGEAAFVSLADAVATVRTDGVAFVGLPGAGGEAGAER